MTQAIRKPIQICTAAAATNEFGEVFYSEITTALCNDGSLWQLRRGNGENEKQWQRLPDIPQGECWELGSHHKRDACDSKGFLMDL